MRVAVRLFAGLRERAGTRARELELAENATVGDVWPALELGDEPAGLLYAVNKAYVPFDHEGRWKLSVRVAGETSSGSSTKPTRGWPSERWSRLPRN